MKILIVEDEKILNNTINKSLKDAGYEVESAFDGFDAMEMIEIESYDLIVLDLNLPNMDGMEILKNLRKEDVETKVLILSARSQIQDKVEGLDAGANDFLQKPFHLDELKARVRSLTRRNFIQNNTELSFDKIKFDSKNRTIFIDDKELKLTRKESGILEYLLLNQGRPVSQEELIDHVWDSSVDLLSNSIRVHISALRKKLKQELGYDPIENRIGIGYLLRKIK
ncbi:MULTISPECIES: response regulator transcription factor [Anaerococcus]|uniref:Response regulator transcription factor n=1 Tax=Anaerococcus obesiensis TaxID=1287640 RepID=A0A7T7UU30_9FIRM|nr:MULTISPECIES: response regulator transcription factor [Anaerococcus]MBS4889680.1 response regulator transcription factor [Anaerococcus vaginalis]MDU2648241.1 response regulator transcription factor [Anaerococcus vaginalis]MDU4378504.1 response regulator transcription factor [Anaerococcus vaginalis]MDU4447530.1 response regulator transcription factor [Anaerococcus vaginalis]MDU5342342.1 response regulator transcription factor [Anaerococcus vaginalis]